MNHVNFNVSESTEEGMFINLDLIDELGRHRGIHFTFDETISFLNQISQIMYGPSNDDLVHTSDFNNYANEYIG